MCLLTSAQLAELNRAESKTHKVFVVENAMLFSQICRGKSLVHPLVCTSGQLNEAAWVLLDMLAESGCEIWYAGDFDPEGLGVADRLWQQYPQTHMWHMSPPDYSSAISRIPIGEKRLQQLKALKCPALQETAQLISDEKKAGYQEALLKYYLADMQKV